MGTAQLRPGISIRDQIVAVEDGGSLADSIRAIGADSIECAVSTDGSVATLGGSLRDAQSTEELMRHAAAEGLRISALLLATDFSGDAAEAQVDWAARMTFVAAQMDVAVVRIDPWTARSDLPRRMVIDKFLHHAADLIKRTADSGVDLGMENHGQIFNDPAVLDQVLSALPDEHFGLTLDTGNLYWWGQPVEEVYRLIKRYAPRAKHTHIKNINYPPELAHVRREIGFEYKQYCSPLGEGNLDLRRIVSLLRQAGYGRDFCVENESLFKAPPGKKLEVLKQDVIALREAAGQIEPPQRRA